MEALLQDVRSGLRQLSAQRGSSAVAVATLALGIGASAAALALIDATILNPFAYVNSAEIVQIEVTVETPDGQVRDTFGSYDHMRAWQALDELFVSVASSVGTSMRGRLPSRCSATGIGSDATGAGTLWARP